MLFFAPFVQPAVQPQDIAAHRRAEPQSAGHASQSNRAGRTDERRRRQREVQVSLFAGRDCRGRQTAREGAGNRASTINVVFVPVFRSSL